MCIKMSREDAHKMITYNVNSIFLRIVVVSTFEILVQRIVIINYLMIKFVSHL